MILDPALEEALRILGKKPDIQYEHKVEPFGQYSDEEIARDEQREILLSKIANEESRGGKDKRFEPSGKTSGTYHMSLKTATDLEPGLKGISNPNFQKIIAENPEWEKELAEKYVERLNKRIDPKIPYRPFSTEEKIGLISGFGYNAGEGRMVKAAEMMRNPNIKRGSAGKYIEEFQSNLNERKFPGRTKRFEKAATEADFDWKRIKKLLEDK